MTIKSTFARRGDPLWMPTSYMFIPVATFAGTGTGACPYKPSIYKALCGVFQHPKCDPYNTGGDLSARHLRFKDCRGGSRTAPTL